MNESVDVQPGLGKDLELNVERSRPSDLRSDASWQFLSQLAIPDGHHQGLSPERSIRCNEVKPGVYDIDAKIF